MQEDSANQKLPRTSGGDSSHAELLGSPGEQKQKGSRSGEVVEKRVALHPEPLAF